MSSVQTHYDQIAENYASRERRPFWINTPVFICKRLLERNNFDVVLDLGCGTGALIEQLSLQFPAVEFIGVDLSEGMLEQAKKRIRRQNCKFFQKDLCASGGSLSQFAEIKKNSRVLVCCFGALEYYDPDAPLTTVIKTIFSDPRVRNSVYTAHNANFFLKKLRKTKKSNSGTQKTAWNYDGLKRLDGGASQFKLLPYGFFVFDYLACKFKFDGTFLALADLILSQILFSNSLFANLLVVSEKTAD